MPTDAFPCLSGFPFATEVLAKLLDRIGKLVDSFLWRGVGLVA